MTTTDIPMDINDDDDMQSDTDTSIYDDEDIDISDDEITDINWRYVFQSTLNNIHEDKFNNGARPLRFDGSCKIRIKKHEDISYAFPLSSALCSRIICEHGTPLSLSNKYDFCGTKIVNSAWQIDRNSIDFPFPFSAAIRSTTFEQLHMSSTHINTHFDLNLHKLVMFGPTSHTKMYNFDDTFFTSLATVLVFLPSHYIGGNYRFIDDKDETHRHVINQHNSKPFILVVPSDCHHEIEPIEKGFKLILIYHLTTNTDSIDQLYYLLSNSNNDLTDIAHIILTQRLKRIFTYWEKHVDKMPIKLLIPLQHTLDHSPYFPMLFRDRYRISLEVIAFAMKHFSSSFLIYSAVFQHDEPFGTTNDSKLVIHSFKLLNTTNEIILDLDPQHERTFLPHEFLGELQIYIDAFEEVGGQQRILCNGKTVYRDDCQFHVLVIIPYQNQWDLLLDDHLFAYHHLSYMLSLPTNALNGLCLNLFECILRDKISFLSSFDQIIRYLILLRHRFGLTPKIIQLLKLLFQNKQFKDELFSNKNLYFWLNRLSQTFSDWSMFAAEFLELFRHVVSSSMPIKLHEIVQFLLQFSHQTLRALFINILLRSIFKRRALPRHILLSTLCSILHLLIMDGSYSIDSLLTLAYNIIKRVRKTSYENEIIEKCFKTHLIPMLIHIYRDIKKQPSSVSLSPAFVLIYEYCLNTLNYYCSLGSTTSSPLKVISTNEALLICPCTSCTQLQLFLVDSKMSTLMYDLSSALVPDHCLRHTLSKFPMISTEYKHDPCTGREQTLIISKCAYEQEQKQLCFHLRRLLMRLHKI